LGEQGNLSQIPEDPLCVLHSPQRTSDRKMGQPCSTDYFWVFPGMAASPPAIRVAPIAPCIHAGPMSSTPGSAAIAITAALFAKWQLIAAHVEPLRHRARAAIRPTAAVGSSRAPD